MFIHIYLENITYTYIHIDICTYTRVCACVYMYIYIYIYIPGLYKHMYVCVLGVCMNPESGTPKPR